MQIITLHFVFRKRPYKKQKSILRFLSHDTKVIKRGPGYKKSAYLLQGAGFRTIRITEGTHPAEFTTWREQTWHFRICLAGTRKRNPLPLLPAVLPAVLPTSPLKLPLPAAPRTSRKRNLLPAVPPAAPRTSNVRFPFSPAIPGEDPLAGNF